MSTNTDHGWCARCFADMGLVDDVLAREETWCPKCGAAIVTGDDWLSDCAMADRKVASQHEWTRAMADGLISAPLDAVKPHTAADKTPSVPAETDERHNHG